MADDIDIEEHDVLNDPRIRNIFPDLTTIKEEVVDPDVNEDQEQTYEPYHPEEETAPFQIAETFSTQHFDNAEYPRHQNKIILGSQNKIILGSQNKIILGSQNKIILGSKPADAIHPIRVKEEPIGETEELEHTNEEHYEEIHEHEEHLPEESEETVLENAKEKPALTSPILKNLLILGSKPGDQPHKSDDDAEDGEIKPSIVLLEDWGPRLERSKCYCNECEILFPTRNVLDSHKMSAHSFLVAVHTNKAVKSTAKSHSSNKAVKSTTKDHRMSTEDLNSASSSKYCNHCQKTFPNSTALITHLYQILKPKPKQQESIPNAHTYLSCPICGLIFKVIENFTGHAKRNHKADLEPIPCNLNDNCRFCSRVYKTQKSFSAHVHINHADLLNKVVKKHEIPLTNLKSNELASKFVKSDVNLQLQTKNLTKKNRRYQCLKCKKIFPNYSTARYHRQRKHRDFKNMNLIAQVTLKRTLNREVSSPKTTSKISSPKTPSLKTSPSLKAYPVPEKVLFKCNTCPLHFINLTSALTHSKACYISKSNAVFKCNICRRDFLMIDRNIHLKQHELTPRLCCQVYVADPDIYHKVLNQCPHCKNYLHEKNFLLHCKNGCHMNDPIQCALCNVNLDQSSSFTHTAFHAKYEFEEKDLILVKFSVNNMLKRKIDHEGNAKEMTLDEGAKTKRGSSGIKRTRVFTKIYHCTNCKTCLFSPKTAQFHLDGKCSKIQHNHRICPQCGLLVAWNKHYKIHKKFPDMKVHDLKFVALQDRKLILPPMPDYPSCKNCGVNVITISALAHHECGDEHKTCKYCKKKFTDLALKLHVAMHEYRKAQNSVKLKKTTPVENMPELLKKYEMLAETWNILYLCQTCDYLYDNYDSVVEHCQNHFNRIESYDVTVKHCKTCDLNFEGKSFDKHKSLHAQNGDITKESFRILTFNYENMLSVTWLEIFKSLPEDHLDHILSQSIYQYSRHFKMTVATPGPIDYTLYHCARCDFYETQVNQIRHLKCSDQKAGRKESRYNCRICQSQVSFSSFKARDSHEATHNLTDHFRVIQFNDPEDEEFNNHIGTQKHINANTDDLYLYRCTVCKLCVKDKRLLKSHDCANRDRCHCRRCGYIFRQKSLVFHQRLHKTNRLYTRENIRIVDLKPGHSASKFATKLANKMKRSSASSSRSVKSLNSTKRKGTSVTSSGNSIASSKGISATSSASTSETTIKLFKCWCGLHFTSTKTIDKHSSLCSTGYDFTKDNCSKCGLLFDTHELFTHLCKHHSSDRRVKFDIEEVDVTKETKATKSPKKQINNRKQLRKVPSKVNWKAYANDLYHCLDCKKHFISLTRYFSHKQKEQKAKYCKKGPGVECDECGYLFSTTTLSRHKFVHHEKMGLKRHEFTVHCPKKRELITSKDRVKSTKPPKPKTILYKCRICHIHFIKPASLTGHMYAGIHNSTALKAAPCDYCGLIFSARSMIAHKDMHHLRQMLRKHDFDIVDRAASWIENRIVSNDGQDSEKDSINSCEKDENDKTILFKCRVCHVHFLKPASFTSHLRRGLHDKITLGIAACAFCGLKFSKRTLKIHKEMHHTTRVMSKKDFHIVDRTAWWSDKVEKQVDERNDSQNSERKGRKTKDNDKNEIDASEMGKFGKKTTGSEISDVESVSESEKRNRRSTQINYTENDSINDNDDVKNSRKRRFEERAENNELVLKDDASKFTPEVFKCNQCEHHFLFPDTLRVHVSKRNHNQEISYCDICGLGFSFKTLTKHKQIHHTIMKLKASDMNVIETGQHYTVVGTYGYDETLPKCPECGVHFTNFITALIHVRGNLHNINKKDCDLCGLTFSFHSLTNHKLIQHQKLGLSIKDFVIKEVHVGLRDDQTDVNSKTEDGEMESEQENSQSDQYVDDFDETEGNEQDEEAQDMDTTSIEEERKTRLEKENIDTTKDTTKVLEKLNPNIKFSKLYKCYQCPQHFMTSATRKSHLIVDNHGDGEQCPICNLQFSAKTLKVHLKHHHKVSQRLETEVIEMGEHLIRIGTSHYDEVIHKCEPCGVHFVNSQSAEAHLERHFTKSFSHPTTRCDVCGLTFYINTLQTHKDIHHGKLNLTLEELKIYNFIRSDAITGIQTRLVFENSETDLKNPDNLIDSENLVTKKTQDGIKCKNVVYKCNVCLAHFLTEKDLDFHYERLKGKKHDIETDLCESCDISFHDLERHNTFHHGQENFKKEELYIIEFFGYSGYLGNAYLYRCGECKAHFTRKSLLKIHCETNDHEAAKIKCKVCNLLLLKKDIERHMYTHHVAMKFKRKDLIIFEVVNNTLIRQELKDEEVDSAVDIQIVTPSKPTSKKTDVVPSETKDTTDTAPDTDKATKTPVSAKTPVVKSIVIPTKYKKTTKLPGSWESTINLNDYDNTVYKCDKCPLHFITLDAMKKHAICRNKNNLDGACAICGLVFGSSTRPKHEYIHHDFHQLGKDDFRIIVRNSNDAKIVDKQRLAAIKEKAKEKREMEKLENMERVKSGPLDKNLYQCSECTMYFLTDHKIAYHKCYNTQYFACEKCGYQLSGGALKKHIIVHHHLMNLKREDFTINVVTRTKKDDISNVNNKKQNNSDSETDSDSDDDKIRRTRSSFNTKQSSITLRSRKSLKPADALVDESHSTLLLCVKCNTYMINDLHHLMHTKRCTGISKQSKCPHCLLQFLMKVLHRHVDIHHTKMKLTRSDFKIIKVNEENVREADLSKLDTSLMNAGETDLSTLDRSLYNNELYKCTQCEIHFINLPDFQLHIKHKYHNIPKYNCTICSLAFSLKALPVHIFIHHEEMKLNREHFLILNEKDEETLKPNQKVFKLYTDDKQKRKPETIVDPKADSSVQSSTDLDSSKINSPRPQASIKLYKCGDCNVYYVSQVTCYRHMLRHQPLDSMEYVDCKLCSLPFKIMSLKKHIIKHHSDKEFQLEDVCIEEYMAVPNGAPKCKIYYAIDKLQSRLVSTTTEKVSGQEKGDVEGIANNDEVDGGNDANESRNDVSQDGENQDGDDDENDCTASLKASNKIGVKSKSGMQDNLKANNDLTTIFIEPVEKNNQSDEEEEKDDSDDIEFIDDPLGEEAETITSDLPESSDINNTVINAACNENSTLSDGIILKYDDDEDSNRSVTDRRKAYIDDLVREIRQESVGSDSDCEIVNDECFASVSDSKDEETKQYDTTNCNATNAKDVDTINEALKEYYAKNYSTDDKNKGTKHDATNESNGVKRDENDVASDVEVVESDEAPILKTESDIFDARTDESETIEID